MMFAAIGAYARRGERTRWAGVKAVLRAGAAAAFVVTPALALVGAALGGLGGAIFRTRAGQPDPVG
jgi:hypothetical protein